MVAFSAEGHFLRLFGGVYGNGPGEINCAHNCTYAEGRLVVCDRNNSRIHIYDALSTEHLETWPSAGRLFPEGDPARTFATNPG
eukprot:SAG31_NODE_12573_length_931_cov_2.223558_1_plen_83_part_10